MSFQLPILHVIIASFISSGSAGKTADYRSFDIFVDVGLICDRICNCTLDIHDLNVVSCVVFRV